MSEPTSLGPAHIIQSREAAIGQWMQCSIGGITRLAHVQFSTDGIRKAYVLTVYKGNRKTGEMLSGEYWKATSDVSTEHAFALLSEMLANEGVPGQLEPPAL